MFTERWEGREKSDGTWEFIKGSEPNGCLSTIVVIFLFIVLALGGLDTIGPHRGSFVHYVFTRWWVYVIAGMLLLLDLLLFCYEIKVFPVAIVEAIIMFVIYMVLGCKGYSIYGEWQEMHSFYESATSFFWG